MNRRAFIGTGAACAGATAFGLEEKMGDGGLAPVSWAERAAHARPVLPPGAHSLERFRTKCVACGLCAAACPSKCLRPSSVPSRLGRIELDFRHGWCKPGCTACGEVCPSGAIEKVGYTSKRLYHVGFAVWDRARCVRTTDGVECHACEKHCPVHAVKLIEGFPVVDRVTCIGCGACEHYCPARPLTAIRVEGLAEHREISPMSETDVLEEMKRQIAEGHAAAVAKGGVIVLTLDGRTLKPIEDAFARDEYVFDGALVADKVVGIGAARIYVRGRARKVWGRVMSEGAKAMLEKNGIVPLCETLVPALACEKNAQSAPRKE